MTPDEVTAMLERLDILTVPGREDRDELFRLHCQVERAASGAGPAQWDLWERLCQTACALHERPLAAACAKRLTARFAPSSLRIRRLVAMLAETNGDTEVADREYNAILKEDPAGSAARARLAAMHRAAGRLDEAQEALVAYLQLFAADASAWRELADLCLSRDNLAMARYCLEELLLLAPEDYSTHTTYADVLYTLGGRANVQLARKYYAQALELAAAGPGGGGAGAGTLRPLLGLRLCLRLLMHGQRQGGAAGVAGPGVSERLRDWCDAEVADLYARFAEGGAQSEGARVSAAVLAGLRTPLKE